MVNGRFARVGGGALIPFAEAHFDTEILAYAALEIGEIGVGVVGVSEVIGINDARPEIAHDGGGACDRHGVGEVHAKECHVNIRERAHFRDVFRIAAQINAFASQVQNVTVAGALGVV